MRPPLGPALGLALLVLTASGRGPAPPAAPETATAPAAPAAERLDLAAGLVVRGHLTAAEPRAYVTPLAAGHYLQLLVDQSAIDLAVRIISPDGEELARADGPAGRRVAEQIALVTPLAGDYRLELRAVDRERPEGDFEIQVEALRPAVPTDRDRVAAVLTFAAAVHLEESDRRAEALERFRASLPLFAAAGDPAGQAGAHLQIGLMRREDGDPRQAIVEYEAAQPLYRQAADPRGAADALNNLGRAYKELGELAAAAEHYRVAVAELAAVPSAGADDLRQQALILNNLALVLVEMGRGDEALERCDEALALVARLAAIDARRAAPLEANVVNSSGLALRSLGRIDEALERYARALAVADRLGNRRLAAAALNNSALCHRLRGQLRLALAEYHRALDLNRELGAREGTAEVLGNLGTAYLELGRPDRAAGLYQQELDLRRELGNPVAAAGATRDLGWTDLLEGRPQAARERFEQALAGIGDQDPGALAATLYALASAHLASGDATAARGFLERCLEVARGSHDAVREAATLAQLGRALAAAGDGDGARRRLNEALALADRLGDPAVASGALVARASLLESEGRLDEARADLERSLAITQRLRTQVGDLDLRATFFARRRGDSDDYVRLLMTLAARRPGSGLEREAFAASEAARARSLLELLHERQIEIPLDGELRRREAELGERLSRVQGQLIDRLSGAAAAGPDEQALRAELGRVEEERDALERQIRERFPRTSELRYPQPLAVADLQPLLARGTAVLEYALGETASFLFVLTRDDFRAYPLELTADDAEQAVRELRLGLAAPSGRRGRAALDRLSRRLYEQLVAPAETALAGAGHLLIVPDRALHYLPFEVLLGAPEDEAAPTPPYLVRRWAVSYAPSASVLPALARGRAAAAGQPTLMVFADPIYAGAAAGAATGPPAASDAALPVAERAGSLAPLPGTAEEARRIAALYPPAEVVVYLQAEASEEHVKGDPRLATARRLHFATHGLLDEERAEYYGLALTHSPGSSEDGLLQVYEIFKLELAADLVVLSACDTGLGRYVTGEGLVGLARGFFYAGARDLVVSLWSVEDRSTAELMDGLYRHLDEEDPAAALRRAKLAMIERGDRWSEPYYWAPFILVGGEPQVPGPAHR